MKKRNLLFMVLMYLITFGIYPLYWYIKFQMELKSKTKKGFGGLGHFLVTILTFGIYAIVWQYKAGKRLAMQGASDMSIIYLVFSFIALGWLNPFLMQNQANNL